MKKEEVHNTPEKVKAYYEDWTDRYMENFGVFFQACQAESPDALIDHVISVCDIQDGQKLLDAGCGIGGPGIVLAQKKKVDIEGLTLSPKQIQIGEGLKEQHQMKGTLNFNQGDYHKMEEIFPKEGFDLVYFLESLCHSDNPEQVIASVRSMLKVGGKVYIKCFFKGPNKPSDPESLQHALDVSDQVFFLKLRDVGDILNLLVKYGFSLHFCRVPTYQINFDPGNSFVARNKIKLYRNQKKEHDGTGDMYLHCLEILAVKYY